MRYTLGLIFLIILLSAHWYNTIAYEQTSTYIAPNAQTGLVSDLVFSLPRDQTRIIPRGETLVFYFGGAKISEPSTIKIDLIQSIAWWWRDFTDYGVVNEGHYRQVRAIIYEEFIEMFHPYKPWYLVGGYHTIIISGIRCNVEPITRGK